MYHVPTVSLCQIGVLINVGVTIAIVMVPERRKNSIVLSLTDAPRSICMDECLVNVRVRLEEDVQVRSGSLGYSMQIEGWILGRFV